MKFLNTEKGKKLGYSSASQLAEYVLRNYLNNPGNTLNKESDEKINKLTKEVQGFSQQAKELLEYFEKTRDETVEKNRQMNEMARKNVEREKSKKRKKK